MPQRGIDAATVPGAVKGWEALRTRFGRLSFARILAPAIQYAETGFPVGEVVSVQVIPRPHEDLAIVLPPPIKRGAAPRKGSADE